MTSNTTSPCYAYNGDQRARVFTPCNPSAPHSMCCRTLGLDGAMPDACLPNGLCSYGGGDVATLDSQRFYIELCTDPSWKDPFCAQFAKYLDGSSCWLVCCPIMVLSCSGTLLCIVFKLLTLIQADLGGAPLGFCQETNTYCCNKYADDTDWCV